MTLTNQPNGETWITGPVVDQAALQGLLIEMHKMGLTLIAVNSIEAESITPFTYYAHQSPITDPKEHSDLLVSLPTDVPFLCQVVQGLILNETMGPIYNVEITEARKTQARTRHVATILAGIRALDSRPLIHARSPGKRYVGTHRTSVVMLCALLRAQGIPARARCGFSVYFAPGFYLNRWACEYWQAAYQCWVLIDPALDNIAQQRIILNFDLHNVPRDQFIPAGRAWQLCRSHKADPERFGIDPFNAGIGYIRRHLLRDLAALNKWEVGSEDTWGLGVYADADLSAEDVALLDSVAALTEAGNDAFAELRRLYRTDPRLGWPPDSAGALGI